MARIGDDVDDFRFIDDIAQASGGLLRVECHHHRPQFEHGHYRGRHLGRGRGREADQVAALDTAPAQHDGDARGLVVQLAETKHTLAKLDGADAGVRSQQALELSDQGFVRFHQFAALRQHGGDLRVGVAQYVGESVDARQQGHQRLAQVLLDAQREAVVETHAVECDVDLACIGLHVAHDEGHPEADLVEFEAGPGAGALHTDVLRVFGDRKMVVGERGLRLGMRALLSLDFRHRIEAVRPDLGLGAVTIEDQLTPAQLLARQAQRMLRHVQAEQAVAVAGFRTPVGGEADQQIEFTAEFAHHLGVSGQEHRLERDADGARQRAAGGELVGRDVEWGDLARAGLGARWHALQDGGRGVGQVGGPMGFLIRVGDRPTFGGDEVAVGRRQRRCRAHRAAVGQHGVLLHQLGHEAGQRPAIQDGVVLEPDQLELGVREAEDMRLEQRGRRQVEAFAAQARQFLRHVGILRGCVHAAQVGHVKRRRRRLVDQLQRLAVTFQVEGGAQDLVAGHDIGERQTHALEVGLATIALVDHVVIGRIVGAGHVFVDHPLLQARHRTGRLDAGRQARAVVGADQVERAGRDGRQWLSAGADPGQVGHAGVGKHIGDAHAQAGIASERDQIDGLDRIAAQAEKVIVNADAIDLKQPADQGAQQLLRRRLGRHVSALPDVAARRRRQCAAVDLAVIGKGQLEEGYHAPRDHIVRHGSRQMPVQPLLPVGTGIAG
ncbi:hypothetical protein D3C85_734450 [compost metagenome]